MRVRSSPKFVDRSRAFQNLSLHHSTFVCNFLFPLLRTFFRRTPERRRGATRPRHRRRRNPHISPPSYANPDANRPPSVAIRASSRHPMRLTTQRTPPTSQPVEKSAQLCGLRRNTPFQRRNPYIDPTPHADCDMNPPNRHHSLHELFRSY